MDSLDLRASEGQRRVVIENFRPCVDGGRFAIKRTVGEKVAVAADVFADGHEHVRAVLRYRQAGAEAWREIPLCPIGNDAWRGEFVVDEVGRYEYTIEGWIDRFQTWLDDLAKRNEAQQDTTLDLRIGAELVGRAADSAGDHDAQRLRAWQAILNAGPGEYNAQAQRVAELVELMTRHADRRSSTRCEPPLCVVVDRERARYSTWYELFPRSCAAEAGRHGTLQDCIAWLPRLARLGFDVVYLPPIHPIGSAYRKGKDNALVAEDGDVGSSWAIGSPEGGHRAILPELGKLADLKLLVAAAAELQMDVALDIAFQCSPDHPYVKEHPQWFRKRPDGSIQYAENPPKKYQDIYPFDFECEDWRGLWRELTDVVLYWCSQGVRILRVDNPHTKPFAFWEYLIARVKSEYPDVILLSEAFTRPKIMYHLAKLGFTQSYTYFTWRNTKAELIEYFSELTQPALAEFFRPNLWPNTPDILPEHLQTGGRPAFVARLVLAATLGANYGIYGPAFENLESRPLRPGSEEYAESEKYQLRHWDFSGPQNLGELIATVNRARRENPALQSDRGLRFHAVDNDQLLCYSKRDGAGTNLIVVVVNLDFHHEQHGYLELPLAELGLDANRPFAVQDLLTGNRFEWRGPLNFVQLDPQTSPAHVFRILPQS